MPILRLNARSEGVALHASPAAAMRAVRSAAHGSGPVIVMIHGFKYDPDCPKHSPHLSIFAGVAQATLGAQKGWMHLMGFGTGDPNEGLAIAFAWQSRGHLWQAQRAARGAGQQLAHVIETLHRCAQHRPLHVITHSMGSEVIFEALHALPAHSIDRIVTLTGASYTSRAIAAMQQTRAGRTATLFNITSRENDPFDFAFERLMQPPVRGDRAIGRGIALANAITLQLDCPRTLAQLAQFGARICAPHRRVCHWSGYTRPGALRFYAHALRDPAEVPLSALRDALPTASAPRWSRLLARPQLRLPLQTARETLS